MIPTKDMTPFVPISTEEITDQILEAADVGITMVHLHVRDEQTGRPTHQAELYRRVISGIRRFRPEIVICVSLSGRAHSEYEKRAEVLGLGGECKPDMGSLTLSSLNFSNQASLNSPDLVQRLAIEMKLRGIVPELEAFDLGMINYAKYLSNKRMIEPPYYFNLILGNVASAQTDLVHIGMMVHDLPDQTIWSLGGIGEFQLQANVLGVAAGGGARTGLEDNIWSDKERSKLARNIEMVKRLHQIIDCTDREVMSPSELRTILGLADGHGSYGRRVKEL